MNSLKSLLAVVVLLACQAVPAQPAPPGGSGGGGRAFGPDRGFGGDRRQGGGRDQFIRHEEPRQGSLVPQRDPAGADPQGRGNLSRDERRALRDQIRDHGRDIYKEP